MFCFLGCVDGARELENHFDTSGPGYQVEMEDVQVKVKPVGKRMMVKLAELKFPGEAELLDDAGLAVGLEVCCGTNRPGQSLND